MLDGLQNEKKTFRARKLVDTGSGKYAKVTLNFKAFDEEDAQRFLDEGGYDGYELTDEKPTAR